MGADPKIGPTRLAPTVGSTTHRADARRNRGPSGTRRATPHRRANARLVDIAAVQLIDRVVLKLPTSGPESEIRGFDEFVIDARGRIAFLRRPGDDSLDLVVVDQQGKLIRTVPLDTAHAEFSEGWKKLRTAGLDTYLMFREIPTDHEKMEAATIDMATGKVAPISGFAAPVGDVAGFPDGGFAITTWRAGKTGDNSLRAFDKHGTQIWKLPGDEESRDLAVLASPSRLVITSDGRIAVLDERRKLVQFFDRSGKYLSTIDLKIALDTKHFLPKEIASDRNGGVLLGPIPGMGHFVRMHASGTMRSQVFPQTKKQTLADIEHAQVAPDGSIWVSNGYVIARLGEEGLLVRELGQPADPKKLNPPEAVTVDGKGRIYAIESGTGIVQMFDPGGRCSARTSRSWATCMTRASLGTPSRPIVRTSRSPIPATSTCDGEIANCTSRPRGSASASKVPHRRRSSAIGTPGRGRGDGGCSTARRSTWSTPKGPSSAPSRDKPTTPGWKARRRHRWHPTAPSPWWRMGNFSRRIE